MAVFEALALPAVILVYLTGLALLVIFDWRINIVALCLQFVGVFILVGLSWPVGMAVAKLIGGWMAALVLGMALLSLPEMAAPAKTSAQARRLSFLRPNFILAEHDPTGVYTGGLSTGGMVTARRFRLLTGVLVGLAVFSMAPSMQNWIRVIHPQAAWGGIVLIGMGLLQLGFSGRTFPVIVGLLTALGGFEVLYSGVEASLLVAGLLAGVNLGLALAGAYLLVSPLMEDME